LITIATAWCGKAWQFVTVTLSLIS
jgi:hypothetical protein